MNVEEQHFPLPREGGILIPIAATFGGAGVSAVFFWARSFADDTPIAPLVVGGLIGGAAWFSTGTAATAGLWWWGASRAPISLISVEKSRNFMQIASAPGATDQSVAALRGLRTRGRKPLDASGRARGTEK